MKFNNFFLILFFYIPCIFLYAANAPPRNLNLNTSNNFIKTYVSILGSNHHYNSDFKSISDDKWVAIQNNCKPANTSSSNKCEAFHNQNNCSQYALTTGINPCYWDSIKNICYDRNSIQWKISSSVDKIISPGKTILINPKNKQSKLTPDNRITTSWVDAGGNCGWGGQTKCLVSEINTYLENDSPPSLNFDAQYGFGMPAGWEFVIRKSDNPGEKDNKNSWYIKVDKTSKCSGQDDQALFDPRNYCDFLKNYKTMSGIKSWSNNFKSGVCTDRFRSANSYSCGQMKPANDDSHYYCVTNEPGLFVISAGQDTVNSYCKEPGGSLQVCQYPYYPDTNVINFFSNGLGTDYQLIVNNVSNQAVTQDDVNTPHQANKPTTGWVCSSRRGYAIKADCDKNPDCIVKKDVYPIYYPGNDVSSQPKQDVYCSNQHGVSYEGDAQGFHEDDGSVDDRYYAGNVGTQCNRSSFDTLILKICPTGKIYPYSKS